MSFDGLIRVGDKFLWGRPDWPTGPITVEVVRVVRAVDPIGPSYYGDTVVAFSVYVNGETGDEVALINERQFRSLAHGHDPVTDHTDQDISRETSDTPTGVDWIPF